MENEFKIGIISDLHCCYPKDNVGNITYLHSNIMPEPVLRNPIEALKKISGEIEIDLLLCPGDITDKCDQQGLVNGWRFIEDLHQHLKSKLLIATLGNHDIDYKKNVSSIFDDLARRLSQRFPTANKKTNQAFWAERFCLVIEDSFILLVYNSVYSFTDEKGAKKPLIDQTTLEKIEELLKPLKNDNRFKFAMCHHHPAKHSSMDYPDDDVIENGDKLLILLYKYNFQIFIHGHKHDPRLSYLHSLPVFGVGSFSSLMNLADLGAENVFHLVTLRQKEIKGTIKTWVYGPQSGWRIKNDSYFPCFTGFGFNPNLEKFASECAEWFNGLNKDMEFFDKISKVFPDIHFLIPSDQEKLNSLLKEKHQIEFNPELPNLPKTISKLMV
jgi:predicted phosphodiesterase